MEVSNRYQVTITKDDIATGYFLSSFFEKTNLRLNYKYFSQDSQFFKERTCINRQFIEGFKVRCTCYGYGYI